MVVIQHSLRPHAVLSPSSAHRWIACPPSVAMVRGVNLDRGEEHTRYQDEGRIAHEVAEAVLRLRLAGDVSTPTIEGATAEMLEYAEDYAGYLLALRDRYESDGLEVYHAIETRVDISELIPGCFGTVDFALWADDELHIIDYKYGRGVRVDARDNPQLRLYALGMLSELELMHGTTAIAITMHIYQPRLGGTAMTTETLSKEELQQWGAMARTQAKLALDGGGDFVAGAHCTLCPARAVCRHLSLEMLTPEAMMTAETNTLSSDEMGVLLARLAPLSAWAKNVEAEALRRATAGETVRGYKLVAGRSLRVWADVDRVAETLTEHGVPEEMIFTRELMSISKLEAELGKKRVGELVGDLIVKPEGKPTLVPESDPRRAINGFSDFI